MSYFSFVTNRPVITILLIKLLDPKKVNYTGKSYCMRFFFVGYIIDRYVHYILDTFAKNY